MAATATSNWNASDSPASMVFVPVGAFVSDRMASVVGVPTSNTNPVGAVRLASEEKSNTNGSSTSAISTSYAVASPELVTVRETVTTSPASSTFVENVLKI